MHKLNDKEKSQIFSKILEKIEFIINDFTDENSKLMEICKLLNNDISYYNWVGFYFIDEKDKNLLNLSEFVGESTEHTQIQVGQGVCGQAVDKEQIMTIQDVSKENNYLSCSIKTKSEIVVPIFKKGNIIGELDIDSHFLAPFTEMDELYLNKICDLISERIL